ncbi:hypothetical protein F0562_010788 [Nyssa sinensis]|uniref:Uncharacterized protein n=1 Tax=Nyssa sinensis TaxID=561372 RepID=A0A5J4ZZW2_9ASTE|nr:hypothetical protein F0562_010788 [Nyssa sinensis]
MNKVAVAHPVRFQTQTNGHPTSTKFPLSLTEVDPLVRNIAEYMLAREKIMWKKEYEYVTGLDFSFLFICFVQWKQRLSSTYPGDDGGDGGDTAYSATDNAAAVSFGTVLPSLPPDTTRPPIVVAVAVAAQPAIVDSVGFEVVVDQNSESRVLRF